MADKKIIIIGAGVAGLSAGIYAQMNGYQTRIYEQHKIPGGLLTAWRRKGYLIDLCIHWLAGSGPGLHLHRYMNELGVLENRQFIPYDRYSVYYAQDGRAVNFYCDPDRLEKHWLELSPQDAQVIHELAEGLRLGIRFNPPEKEQYEASTFGWIKFVMGMMPILGGVQKWSKITVGELANRFQSPLLREALLAMFEPDFSVFYMVLSQMGFMYRKQAAYPVGGSLPLALTFAKRYQQLGGQVQYQARVKKILVEALPDGRGCRAVGIQLEDGTEDRADVVISAADGFSTIYRLLEGRFIDPKIRVRYERWTPMQSVVYASVGVNRTFPDIPFAVEGSAFELKHPVVIGGKEHCYLPVRVHNQEPGFAQAGKTVLTSAIFTPRTFWKSLEGDRAAYEAQKEKDTQAYLEALEQIWPGISAQVEMCNLATPLTFERITGNWQASITGWKLTPEQATTPIPRTLPGLENFWMVGQWVYAGGGVPAGVSTGREVIWKQCQKDKQVFTTKKAW